MIKAAKCCNQHLKNIIILWHFQFFCSCVLKTEWRWMVTPSSFQRFSKLFSMTAACQCCYSPCSHISLGRFPQLKLILSIQSPLSFLLSACHTECARILMWSVPLTQWNPSSSILVSPGSELHLRHQLKANFSMRYRTWLSPCAGNSLISCSSPVMQYFYLHHQ